MKTHLGNIFTDTNGVVVKNYQLLNQNGYAVALADFDGSKCIRFMFADSIRKDALRWFLNLIP